MSRPTLLITMGDPAGIGPEIIVKSWPPSSRSQHQVRLLVVGSAPLIAKAAKRFNSNIRVEKIQNIEDASHSDALQVIDSGYPNLSRLPLKKPSALGGEAAIHAIEDATRLCQSRDDTAMVTTPVSKEAIEMTGKKFIGHTEWIADMCKAKDEMMMMNSPKINVGYVTTHIALRALPRSLNRNRVVRCIELTHAFLEKIQKKNKCIAVCGLNPHAGENGLFGKEDLDIIAPAIRDTRKRGIDVQGPFPADTLFTPQKRKTYGAFLAMYHDQGGIPFKMLAFDDGVNITLGLPIVRTSVDHGTAWDIAWQGKASPNSLKAAIRAAVKLKRTPGKPAH